MDHCLTASLVCDIVLQQMTNNGASGTAQHISIWIYQTICFYATGQCERAEAEYARIVSLAPFLCVSPTWEDFEILHLFRQNRSRHQSN
jgi:hypothetical protein